MTRYTRSKGKSRMTSEQDWLQERLSAQGKERAEIKAMLRLLVDRLPEPRLIAEEQTEPLSAQATTKLIASQGPPRLYRALQILEP